MKRIILTLISLTFCILIYAQPNWERTVQFFTPNAETLGKYGQVPVNYFSGLPQISIPVTNFKVNGYELPITLSYYAGGNKPDSHPGWVGLGWNLSAGGSINRIINGIKDETTNTETEFFTGVGFTNNTGYYYRMDSVNRTNWSDSTYLNYVGSRRLTEVYSSNLYPYDTEPDEFQVNIDDISASFFLTGNNQVKIKSKSNEIFKIQVSLSANPSYLLYSSTHGELDANCFTYINEIILTRNNGIKYYFGGDMSAIEFSFINNTAKFTANANTWHVKKIVIPNGETITFNYEKDGIPIIEQNNHFLRAYYLIGYPYSETVNTKSFGYLNYNYTFIQPSYLSSIQSTLSGRVMNFRRSQTNELGYNINTTAFDNRVLMVNPNMERWGFDYDYLNSKSYYMQLDSIIDNNKKYVFNYSNSTDTRLKVMQLSCLDSQNALVDKYLFEYNTTSLPNYNSKKNDNWGFFNNKYYDNIDYPNLYSFRTPDSTFMKAEILQKITYPTGGNSQFIYESHDFSKFAKQFEFELKDSTSICGGLRIKKIITTDTSNKTFTREFIYLNKNNQSSGVLSGVQIYNISGDQHIQYKFSGWSGLVYYTSNTDYNYKYYLDNQQILNQLSSTSGNHITYSRVMEKLSDGSKIVYNYTNHEKYPDENPTTVLDNIDNKLPLNSFISKELERGLLDSVEYYNNNDMPVKKELYYYNSNQNRYSDFVKSISIYSLYGMIRLSALKIFTFCPYLEKKKEITFDNNQKLITETSYKYDNNYRILTNEVVKDSHGDSITTVYTYPFHVYSNYLAPAPPSSTPYNSRPLSSNLFTTCFSMTTSNFLNSPVEITTYKNQKVINSKLIHYGQHGNDFLPDSIYTLELTTPISNFLRYYLSGNQPTLIDDRYEKTPSTLYKYDSKSNITQIKGKDGLFTSYLWGYNYQYPIAEIKNVTIDQVTTSLGGASVVNNLALSNTLTDTNIATLNSLKTSLPSTQITIFTYKQFVGMLKKIDPNGIITNYEYDNFNRLKWIKDTNGNLIQEYQYHFSNQ